ncbi:MAG: pyridoxamine 5'-phosphate oxidase [Wolbachia sp.]|nr:pyridoxamine 5'-phosphate oxidase [Wolbachia sp.]MDD9335815.1 pyridoxamine 5'-phosphate oxidase [Wolbachia sp.]
MTFLPKKDPINLFSQWYKTVSSTAMTLATCNKGCTPSARIVLLKEYSKRGFVFFTNVNSRKGRELTKNPKAALVFHWADFSKQVQTMEFSRQVRIEGNVKLLSSDKADEYFSSRSRDSKISAWCSKQSNVLKNWQDFEQDIECKNKEFYNQQISRPNFWVGFCVVPKVIEFLEEGEHRRHTRFKYTLIEENNWKIEQLYP